MVDDEEFCISTIKLLLKLSGIISEAQVDYCLNGKEAVDKVREASAIGLTYKLILTDFSMPILDGIQATQLIRDHYGALNPENQPTIVGITGHV